MTYSTHVISSHFLYASHTSIINCAS